MRSLIFTLWALAGVALAEGSLPLAPLDGAADTPPPPWHVAGLPSQSKPYTHFDIFTLEGQRVLRVVADKSYGNLVHPLPAGTPARSLRWRWRVDEDNPVADLRRRGGDDNAIEVCAAFDEPMEQVPYLERQILKLARLRSSEPVPSATLCYVWDSHFPSGTVLDNAFTRRVRLIVLRGEGSALQSWTSERRDLRADFLRAFGDEAREVPPLTALAVAADADNTQQRTLAYVADLSLEP